MACCFGVPALAEPPASNPPKGQVPEPAEIHLPDALVDIDFRERRYKIEALSFKARDETGVDWWGSDEVMVKTTDAEGWSNSGIIGDVDTGDVVTFSPAKSCIIGVQAGTTVLNRSSVCDDAGRAAPLWFTVEMWEDDAEGPMGSPYGCSTGAKHDGDECVPGDGQDDFIGNARLDFAAWELEAALPEVGDEYVETVVLNPCGDALCASPFLADYSFTYRITRMPDHFIDLPALLATAMERSGARSGFEAIVAGLNSLPVRQPRRIETTGQGAEPAAK